MLILLVTLLGGLLPFIRRDRQLKKVNFPIGESFAVGVFLGAALVDMLPGSLHDSYKLGYHYPFTALITGGVFLLFLWLEHKGKDVYKDAADRQGMFAVIATIMLSLHAYFAGVALGYLSSMSIVIVFLLAVLAHKWVASFALSVQINKSSIPKKTRWLLFIIFACMTPLGVASGEVTHMYLSDYPLIEPIFQAMAAGTFLYLGTLHGLEQSALIKNCCDLKRFYFVIVGFICMSIVAIWA